MKPSRLGGVGRRVGEAVFVTAIGFPAHDQEPRVSHRASAFVPEPDRSHPELSAQRSFGRPAHGHGAAFGVKMRCRELGDALRAATAFLRAGSSGRASPRSRSGWLRGGIDRPNLEVLRHVLP